MNLSAAINRGRSMEVPLPCPLPYFSLPAFENRIEMCPLGAAYLGSLRDDEIAGFWTFLRALSHDSLCRFMHKNLMRVFPHLGQSVRAWPRLAEQCEAAGWITVPPLVRRYPNAKRDATSYRASNHMSLWRSLTAMHDAGWPRDRIVTTLERAGL